MMAVGCIVPASPTKSSKDTKNDSGLSDLLPARTTISAHIRAGVSNLQEVTAESSSRGSAFRLASASANRDALKALHQSNKSKKSASEFRRNASAGFRDKSRDGHTDIVHRGADFKVIEDLRSGPQTFTIDDKDPHFLNIEPNSKIALRKRFVSHLDFQGHLEGRTFVSISQLHSVARPEKSDDGDYTIPIEGDWLITGVLTSKVKRIVRPTVMLGFDGNEIDERVFQQRWRAYKQRKGDQTETLDDEDNPYREVKEVRAALTCISATLTDMGQPLVRGETAGDSQIELTMFQSLSERQSTAQHKEPFTVIDLASLGSVVCLLNPFVKKRAVQEYKKSNQREDFLAGRMDGDRWRGNGGQNGHQSEKSPTMRLQARKGEALLVIGIAADYKACGAMCRNGQLCDNFVDARSRLSACSFHAHSAASRHRNVRQEFANGTSSFFSQKDAPMFSSQSRTYISTSGSHNRSAANPSSSAFRVDQRYGREKELKRLREEQMQAEDEIRNHLQRMKGSSTVSVSSKHYKGEPAPTNQRNALQNESRNGNGAKAVDDAMRALLHSRGVKDLDAALGVRAKLGKRSRNDSTSRATPQSGSTTPPSKLLARHTATSASSTRPILRTKKAEHNKSAVRPPPGQSFYACDSSDEELDALVAEGTFDPRGAGDMDDDDSDIEIVR